MQIGVGEECCHFCIESFQERPGGVHNRIDRAKAERRNEGEREGMREREKE